MEQVLPVLILMLYTTLISGGVVFVIDALLGNRYSSVRLLLSLVGLALASYFLFTWYLGQISYIHFQVYPWFGFVAGLALTRYMQVYRTGSFFMQCVWLMIPFIVALFAQVVWLLVSAGEYAFFAVLMLPVFFIVYGAPAAVMGLAYAFVVNLTSLFPRLNIFLSVLASLAIGGALYGVIYGAVLFLSTVIL